MGIAADCSFRKLDARGYKAWVLGPNTEFIYTIGWCGYEVTDAAYAANKLRAAVVNSTVHTLLPTSVALLQGVLSESMLKNAYPNVAYVTFGLCSKSDAEKEFSVAAKLPSIRWVLPTGKVRTEMWVKRAEGKLTPMLPEICAYMQELYRLDLTRAENRELLLSRLLCSSYSSDKCDLLFQRYGMIYAGDYGAVLRGNE